MRTVKKLSGTAVSIPMGVILGSALSFLITCALAGLLTWAVLGGFVSEKALGYFVMAILLIASFTGTLVSGVKIQRRRMLVSLITGVVYYAFLFAVTGVFFGGNYSGIGTTGFLILVGALTSGILGLKSNKMAVKCHVRYRSC